MPQAQVLPYVPSFGEKLADTLAQAGANLGQGYVKRLENQRAQVALGTLLDPTKTPLQHVSAFMSLPESLKKSSGPVLAAIVGPRAEAEAQANAFNNLKSSFGGVPTNANTPPVDINGLSGTSSAQLPNAQQALHLAQPNGMPAQNKPPQKIQQPQQQIDPNNPETWTDDQLLQLSTLKGPYGELGKDILKNRREIKKEERNLLGLGPKKYLENVEDYREKARNIDLALNAELDAIFAGEVDPFSKGHIAELLKQFDLPQALTAPLETVGSKEFRTGQKTFLTSTFKDAFRGATTKGQIELASSLLAETGAKREANLASVYLLQAQHMIEKERVRLTDEGLEQGVSPYKIQSYVNQRLDDYAKFVNDQYFIEVQNLRKEAKQ